MLAQEYGVSLKSGLIGNITNFFFLAPQIKYEFVKKKKKKKRIELVLLSWLVGWILWHVNPRVILCPRRFWSIHFCWVFKFFFFFFFFFFKHFS